MISVTCIGCLHGHYPELEGGDLLIVTGDLTARHTGYEHFEFNEWLDKQKYRKIILIAGNHDTWIEKVGIAGHGNEFIWENFKYLCDSGTEFEGLKIWGSPWTKTFLGMNPKCKAFAVDTEEELAEKWALIPDDIDILICHSPPYGILDKIKPRILPRLDEMNHVGSMSLRNAVLDGERFKKLKLVVFSHIHEGYGMFETTLTKFVNCSIMNQRYKPVNKPITIEL